MKRSNQVPGCSEVAELAEADDDAKVSDIGVCSRYTVPWTLCVRLQIPARKEQCTREMVGVNNARNQCLGRIATGGGENHADCRSARQQCERSYRKWMERLGDP